MGQEIIVFSVPVNCGSLRGRELTEESVANYLSREDWSACCRNGWFQDLLHKLIQTYGDFDELSYLANQFALLSPDQLPCKRQAIHKLLMRIQSDTQPFLDVTRWYGATAEEVREYIGQATVKRHLDDDCVNAFSNFFSFLVSHVAALEEAENDAKCLLHATLGW